MMIHREARNAMRDREEIERRVAKARALMRGHLLVAERALRLATQAEARAQAGDLGWGLAMDEAFEAANEAGELARRHARGEA